MRLIASFIIPVFNEEKYLKKCIDSLLSQTERDFEIVIVDDGSTDNSINILNSYKDTRIRIHRQKNQGRVLARNKALKMSRGKYIIFQDGDDWSEPDRLEKQLLLAEKCAGSPVIGTAIMFHREGDNVAKAKIFKETDRDIRRIMKRPIFRQEFHPPTMLALKNKIIELGGWNKKFTITGEDGDLLSRLSEDATVVFSNTPEPLYHYRQNVGSVTPNLSKSVPSQMFMRYCERARRKGIREPDTFEEYLSERNRFISKIEFFVRCFINYSRWRAMWIR